ncbi:unnamed protein product [Caenorhabditis brenneri]
MPLNICRFLAKYRIFFTASSEIPYQKLNSELSEWTPKDDFLLEFIKNEAINKEPVFDSYKKICEKIGDINYLEFEYFYMEFYRNPEFKGTDYDGSTKPKFSDLPIEVVYKIVDKLEPVHRVFLRYVSKSLRSIVDDLQYPLRQIEFHEIENGLKIFLNHVEKVKFTRTKNGCEVKTRYQKAVIDGGSYVGLALNLLESILSNPRLRLNDLIFAHHHDAKVFNYCIKTLAANEKIPKIDTKDLSIFASTPINLEPFQSLISEENLDFVRFKTADEETMTEIMKDEVFKTIPAEYIHDSAFGDRMMIDLR